MDPIASERVCPLWIFSSSLARRAFISRVGAVLQAVFKISDCGTPEDNIELTWLQKGGSHFNGTVKCLMETTLSSFCRK